MQTLKVPWSQLNSFPGFPQRGQCCSMIHEGPRLEAISSGFGGRVLVLVPLVGFTAGLMPVYASMCLTNFVKGPVAGSRSST